MPLRTDIAAIVASGPHQRLISSMNLRIAGSDFTSAAGIVARVTSMPLSRKQAESGQMFLRTKESIPEDQCVSIRLGVQSMSSLVTCSNLYSPSAPMIISACILSPLSHTTAGDQDRSSTVTIGQPRRNGMPRCLAADTRTCCKSAR